MIDIFLDNPIIKSYNNNSIKFHNKGEIQMKKQFKNPVIAISEFTEENIVTSSSTEPGTNTYDFGTVTVDAKDVLRKNP